MNTIILCSTFRKFYMNPKQLPKIVYSLFQCHTLPIIPINVYLNSTKMSQKRITNFFNLSPKVQTGKENTNEPMLTTNNESNSDDVDKKKTKRSRSSNSDGNSSKHEESPSPKSSEKKKIKRPRIESSESEPDSATISSPDNHVQLEKHNLSVKPKTYESPKNKKIKSEKNIVKIEHKTPSPKKTPKEMKTSHSYFTVKVEKRGSGAKDKDLEKENVNKVEDDSTTHVTDVDYNPAKSKYHPVRDACWSKGQAVPYLALAKTLEAIEATSARLKMIEILSNYFRSVIALTPEDLLPSIYLCLNQLAPAYHSLELGIAETYLMKAVGQCTGRTLAQMRAAAQRCGDLGQVAQAARGAQRTMFAVPPLTARHVLAALRDIAAVTGQASVNKKISKIQSLYVACRHSEARYLIRCLEGKLRVGLAEQSLLQALATAVVATPPDGSNVNVSAKMDPDAFKARVEECALVLKRTYCECPNYELVVPALLEHGPAALPDHCRLTPGIPLKPMLAHPAKGVHEVFARFDNEVFTCEWKYDGERAQIHVPGDDSPDYSRAAVYSRNQENTTSKYPDILSRLPSLLKESVRNCVLDCEAVAFDTQTKQILPFQILSTRKRKDAAEADIKVQVCVFIFDLLYLNDEPLVRRDLFERRSLLREHFNRVEGQWQLAEAEDCGSEEELQAFLERAVRGSCEGLMVKTLRGPRALYDIARRSHNWLKLKKDYLEGVGDTIDAVVIGGYHGRGKRAGVYGGFLLACYDATTEQYQSLCKIGTGFSDEDLKTLSEALNKHIIDGPRNYYMQVAQH